MGAKTGIEWTDATWNPFGGCSVTSPGCTNCYAMRIAGSGRLRNHPLYAEVTTPSKAGPVFNGRLTAAADDADVWTWPLRWRGSKTPKLGAGKPSMIFVGDMADLFHEDRPEAVIDRVFAVMALAPQHIFQVLTKRPKRMRTYIRDAFDRIVIEMMILVDAGFPTIRESCARHGLPWAQPTSPDDWYPFHNVWLGVSVEDRPNLLARIGYLKQTPAAKRFLSTEPLLGDLGKVELDDIDWVIVGGESGPNARDNDFVGSARSILGQCRSAGVAFFGKQNVRKRPLPTDLLVREFPA